MRNSFVGWLIAWPVVFLTFCSKPASEPNPYEYIPSPKSNPITVAGVAMGKVLFSDRRLSEDGNMSCATCHIPQKEFVTSDVRLSFSKKGRNIPALYNLAWAPRVFWDGAEENLESLMIKPIIDTNEMHGNLKEVASRLQQDPAIRRLSSNAFGLDSVYIALVSRSLSQYIRTLVKPKPVKLSSDLARKGEAVFRANCAGCHSGIYTSDFKLRRSVLAAKGSDLGYFQITRLPQHKWFFKTPSLASVSKTAPYMHNGSVVNLDMIVKGYAEKLGTASLQSAQSRLALVAYLNEL